MDPEITIAGLPVRLAIEGTEYVVSATFQNVRVNGSPLVVTFDPPIAGVANVPAAQLLLALLAALAGGAEILPF